MLTLAQFIKVLCPIDVLRVTGRVGRWHSPWHGHRCAGRMARMHMRRIIDGCNCIQMLMVLMLMKMRWTGVSQNRRRWWHAMVIRTFGGRADEHAVEQRE